MDDSLARYDPLEAVDKIAEATGVDERTVANILESEAQYLGCIGMLDETELEDDEREEISVLRNENADLLGLNDGEYDLDAAASFIQRNRGIDRETINWVLEANFRFMDERGFLDEEWGSALPAKIQ